MFEAFVVVSVRPVRSDIGKESLQGRAQRKRLLDPGAFVEALILYYKTLFFICTRYELVKHFVECRVNPTSTE